MNKRIAKLALEDGTVFTGRGFGAGGTSTGQVVFNTAMSGYQELLTDPAHEGQIVAMTYPLAGNTGINPQDFESALPHGGGLVVKEVAPAYSNYRATQSLENYLQRHHVIGIEGIDTRALVRRLRLKGEMRGALSTEILDDAALIARARQAPEMVGADWVSAVKPDQSYEWTEDLGDWGSADLLRGDGLHVAALDCGARRTTLRQLVQRGVKVTVLPPDAAAETILALKPNGLLVSGGPGDPSALEYAVRSIRDMIEKLPIFGIDLGHLLLARALGADTFKMSFGHRGGNQPVMNLEVGRVEITSQNHGFSADRSSLERSGGIVTHINLNDQTVEGFRHRDLPVFAVQYHPQASPGPHDATYLLDAFTQVMESGQPLKSKR